MCPPGFTAQVLRRTLGRISRMASYIPLLVLPVSVLILCLLLIWSMGMPQDRFVLFAFLVFGTIAGLLSVLVWPMDLGVYLNIPGTAAGDWLYRSSIRWIGDLSSDQAHYTIPWVLRIPQIYAWISPLIYTGIGLPVQYAYNRIRNRWGRVGKAIPEGKTGPEKSEFPISGRRR